MIIWIFNPFDEVPWEGPVQRYAALAATLASAGHTVVWWSSDFSHRRKAFREQGAWRVDVRLIQTPAYQKNISLRRIWNHWVYGRRLYRDCLRAVTEGELAAPDVILASLPPMEGPVAALRLRVHFGCRVITDVMDTWPETLLQAAPAWAIVAARLVLWPYRHMLRRACRGSNAICAQSKAFAGFARHHGAGTNIHVCYLGAEAAVKTCATGKLDDKPSGSSLLLGGEESETGKLDAIEVKAPLRLLYLGSMGRSYDLETVVDVVAQLNGDSAGTGECCVECVFIGDGEKRSALEARAVPGVRFTGYLTGTALRAELTRADLGLVPFFPESGVAVPYKAGEYLAYGLPILNTIKGELSEHLAHYSCGVDYRAGSADSLLSAVRHYLEQPEVLAQARQKARACFQAHFDRATIYPAWAEWVLGEVDA